MELSPMCKLLESTRRANTALVGLAPAAAARSWARILVAAETGPLSTTAPLLWTPLYGSPVAVVVVVVAVCARYSISEVFRSEIRSRQRFLLFEGASL